MSIIKLIDIPSLYTFSMDTCRGHPLTVGIGKYDLKKSKIAYFNI